MSEKTTDSSCFQSCALCPVRERSLFAGLSAEAAGRLSRLKSHRAYKKGESVFTQGGEVNGIHCIGAGSVKVTQKEPAIAGRAAKKSKALFVRVAGPGDSVGHRSVFTRETYLGAAATLEPAHLCFVPKAALLGLLDTSSDFSLRFIRRMSRDIEITESNQRALRSLSVRERTARLLLQLHESHGQLLPGGGVLLDAPVSRTDLAAMLGVADETLIRMISEFRRLGWLAPDRKRIVLLNLPALTKLAGR